MNISLDKALLWLIPYLYLLSVTYYWGFWGTFNVDAFSYYAVSDLVKGVIAPIGTPAALMALLIFGALALIISAKTFSNWLITKEIRVITQIVLSIFFAFVFFFCFRFAFAFFVHKRLHTDIDDKNHLIAVLTSLFFVLAVVLSFVTAASHAISKSFNYFFTTILYTGFLLYLPCQGFLAGKENAMRISQNKEFDYVIADSLAGPKGFYKYLGKAGDYHVLVTLDNVKRIIVPADELNPLVIEQYSLDVPASIRRFRFHIKQLVEPVMQKAPPNK